MDSQKLLVSRENPRQIPFPTASKPLPNDLSHKSPPTILDRFRALVKQREEEIRVSGDDTDIVPPPLSTGDVVQLYELLLSELIFNSKPIITDLTIVAGEQREHAEGIADAICARIVEVPVDQKLPSLYLLDSIVKNIGREYVKYFSPRLPEVFCEAYRQIQPNLYKSMRHLFGTWSTVFPPSVLRKIETELEFSSEINNRSSSLNSLRASESPRPTHGIHVNPKYLRQLEHSTVDNLARGAASTLKYGQKPAIDFDVHDSDPMEEVGAQRINTATGGGRTSFALGANKIHSSQISRSTRPLSPARIGVDRPLASGVDDFAAFEYGAGRVIGKNVEINDWKTKNYSGDNRNRFETSIAYGLSNGLDLKRPRALIDAYGEDKGNRITNTKPPLQVERLDVNGISSTTVTRSWQSTEEEEFDWEDMSPTLADRGPNNEFLPSATPPFGNIRARPGLERSGRLSTGNIPGYQTQRNQNIGSGYYQETWSSPNHFPRSGHLSNTKGRGKDLHIPFPGSDISSSRDYLASNADKFSDSDAVTVRPPAMISRLGSNVDSNGSGTWSGTMPTSTAMRPPVNVHKSNPPPIHSLFPPQNEIHNQFDSINSSSTIMNQGLPKPSFIPDQHFNNFHSKEHTFKKQLPLPNQRDALSQQNQVRVHPFRSNYHPSLEKGEKFPPSSIASMPPLQLAPPASQGYGMQGVKTATSIVPSNHVPVVQLPLAINNVPNIHLQMGIQPPLPPGPPPSQLITIAHNAGQLAPNQPAGGAFPGLINSLMAQGLISLPAQDPIGLEFNADLLKVRNELAVSPLYTDLPRQCTTCGLRFKCQEEHSSHMDWHVTKNRMSKNRKQKPSRKWFVSGSMWLSGAEALGSEAVPGFLPTETIIEKKDDEEMAVPAEEEQTACALCGEPFDDFYSDETEEWMYKGAVYLNAPNGSTVGLDRSELGPIVHAKCRTESSVIPS
ncbi:hypothetical protein K2173_005592 [Erythroxylum novogranatense]|uniref:CID domain-containing protein n=1 Tax=Erythroxylum novogranatense TaxID=1862640 RepID=A0AAV8T676_9ROSI|nr:hypothetical protein K2173_005592 [Erythroxylum novogranatense]